jgi:hypothetical protein
VSTRRGATNTRRVDSNRSSASQLSRERLGSTVTVLAIEKDLMELGIHPRLSDLVAKAQSVKNGIVQSRSRRERECMC